MAIGGGQWDPALVGANMTRMPFHLIDKARRFLEEAEAFSKKVLHEKACEDIPKSKYIFAATVEQYPADADQMESLKSIVHENGSLALATKKWIRTKRKTPNPRKLRKNR